jgi:hypothetical protein
LSGCANISVAVWKAVEVTGGVNFTFSHAVARAGDTAASAVSKAARIETALIQ